MISAQLQGTCGSQRATARRAGLLAAAFVAVLAAFLLALALPAGQAHAAKSDPYDYTVRVFGGNQGTVGGAPVATYTVPYGGSFSLSKDAVALADDSKYYVKGFRLSGQDDLHVESFSVTEDMDFVVAYGVRGDMVSYTLNFVEYGTGRVLADPITYYGNLGDKPIAAYEYIEGYRPLYRNITGTLASEGSNVWTFEYVALEQEQQQPAQEQAGGNAAGAGAAAGAAAGAGAAGVGDGAAAGAGTGDNAGAGAGAGAGDNAAGAADGAAADAATGDASAQAEPAEPPATEEILDTDVALASGVSDDAPAAAEAAQDARSVPVVPIVAGAVAIVALVGVAYVALRRRPVR